MVYTHTPPILEYYIKCLGVYMRWKITKGIKGKLSGGESSTVASNCGAVCYYQLVAMKINFRDAVVSRNDVF